MVKNSLSHSRSVSRKVSHLAKSADDNVETEEPSCKQNAKSWPATGIYLQSRDAAHTPSGQKLKNNAKLNVMDDLEGGKQGVPHHKNSRLSIKHPVARQRRQGTLMSTKGEHLCMLTRLQAGLLR